MSTAADTEDTFQPEEASDALTQSHDDDTEKLMRELFPGNGDGVNEEMIRQLSEGLLSRFMPTLLATNSQLQELTENQRIQIETLLQENAKFSESEDLKTVKAIMDKGKLYQEKLVKIKREMLQLHEKSARLKKRAIALEQQRQRQALQEEHEKDLQAARERALLAKPAAKPT